MVEALFAHPLEYAICIIGAGPAGLTLASQLAYDGLRVCVLESGESERSPFTDNLKNVEFDGLPIKASSRERIVGGASATWDGRSAPLDEIDFEPRGWPGWPISREEILQYQAAAVQYRFPASNDFDVPTSDACWGPWEDLALKMFVAVKPPYRFNSIQSVFGRSGMDLWTGATVIRLQSRSVGIGERMVTEAVCRLCQGLETTVTARQFVLAAGAIENARILLNSCNDEGSLGNEHDQVGRYFMNHPKGYAGILHLARPVPRSSPFLDRAHDGKTSYAGLTLAPDIQRARGLLNSYVRFEPGDTIGHEVLARIDRLRVRTHESKRLRILARLSGSRWALVAPLVRTLRLRWYLEMEPRSTNRITLAGRTDAFGSRLPHVHYDLGERDRETIAVLHHILQQNIARRRLGRLESTAEEVLAAATVDASHHLGGTRMGADPWTSVVDRQCRVHRTTNLFVAGSSVFSSGGCANPTLTIVALAMRLAAHLRSLSAPPTGTVLQTVVTRPATRYLLIGAGRRVRGDVVPSLESHCGRFQIAGIYARTTASVFGPHRRYDVQSMALLTDSALADARFIYVGVPREAVLSVLKSLRRWRHCELILDTPVPTSAPALELLREFKRVHVAEDCAYLPWLEAARRFWSTNGLKGPLQIECDRSAYRYHGVAFAKALCGTRETPDTVIDAERSGGVFSIRLTNGSARITEPRDYAVGMLRVTRDGVTISSHAAEGAVPIEVLTADGLCVGFAVGGARASLSRPESILVGKVAPRDTVVSLMGPLKRVGLARMFAMMEEGHDPWPLARGLDDSAVDQVVVQ